MRRSESTSTLKLKYMYFIAFHLWTLKKHSINDIAIKTIIAIFVTH